MGRSSLNTLCGCCFNFPFPNELPWYEIEVCSASSAQLPLRLLLHASLGRSLILPRPCRRPPGRHGPSPTRSRGVCSRQSFRSAHSLASCCSPVFPATPRSEPRRRTGSPLSGQLLSSAPSSLSKGETDGWMRRLEVQGQRFSDRPRVASLVRDRI